MSKIIIQGGRLIDPETGIDEIGDLVIEDGRILALFSAAEGGAAGSSGVVAFEAFDIGGGEVAAERGELLGRRAGDRRPRAPVAERDAITGPCDDHLRAVAATLQPEWIIGVGRFALDCARRTHGEIDHDVPIGQAEEFFIALKKRGVPTTFIRYPREGHGIRESAHRVDSLDRSMNWFEHYFARSTTTTSSR